MDLFVLGLVDDLKVIDPVVKGQTVFVVDLMWWDGLGYETVHIDNDVSTCLRFFPVGIYATPGAFPFPGQMAN